MHPHCPLASRLALLHNTRDAMTRREAEKRAAGIARKLEGYQHAYFVEAKPLVSDREYDGLFDALAAIEREFPDLAREDSPTRRVGSDLTQELPEAAHTIPVLSLDKAYASTELSSWIEKTARNAGGALSFVCEEKIDGASIVLYYQEGLLARAVTRGNGLVGNDVTGNVRTIGSVPLRLSRPLTMAARGEIFLAKSRFARVNAAMEEPYANPRNLAAGTLRRVKSREAAGVPLEIFIYEGFFEAPRRSHTEILEEMEELGFRINPHVGFFSDAPERKGTRERHPAWAVGRLDDIGGFIDAEKRGRGELDYEIDGIVVKVNEIPAREALGYTGHHPRWAVAFKFESPEGATTVKAIEAQVGRTGRITPVARVEPVRISGATISNVTLHNQEYIDMLELAVGDRVAVSRRGDVIPAVERVLEKNEADNTVWKLPPACPTCSAALEKLGAHHFCPNLSCPDQIRGRLNFFAARGQMDIEGLGPETIDVLLKNGLVNDIQDIYSFDPAKLLDLPGFGEKKAAAIREGIEKSKKRPFRMVFQSLGIPDIGQKATELLIDAGYADIDSLLALADAGDIAPLLEIHGIGERTAETLIQELRQPQVRNRIEGLRAAGLQMRELKERGERGFPPTFAGETWCVTGSFESFTPREKAMEEVAKRGGKVSASVTAKTTHLLVGENPGSK
ncbi:MAG: NAD-dependent DNA ligase LigA, partial [Spirochaetes bacterium]|nr:NAD-dependent DNA ligase LigA [Spirochaetota bacterium]